MAFYAAALAYRNGRANATEPTVTAMRYTGFVVVSGLAVGDGTSAIIASPMRYPETIAARRTPPIRLVGRDT